MALIDTGIGPEQPWGVIVTYKDETNSHILFVYPTGAQRLERTKSIEDMIETIQINRPSSSKSWHDELRFGIPLSAFGTLMEPKDPEVTSINIKVDSIRFIGQWFRISEDRCVDEEIKDELSIAFAINGHSNDDIVDLYSHLTNQVVKGVKSLQRSHNFVRKNLESILYIHEAYEKHKGHSEFDGCPFEECLRSSPLLESLKRIFNDVFYFGSNLIYLNDKIQLDVIIRSKALLYCNLLPRTTSEMTAMRNNIKPYHTLLFVDNEMIAVGQHPLAQSFLEHYSPERTLEEMRMRMRCTQEQLVAFVKHIITWGRAVVIFPVCLQNTYTVGPSSQISLKDMADHFDFCFPGILNEKKGTRFANTVSFLAEILEFLSPASTLEEFYMNISRFLPLAANTEMVMFLLRTGLIIQLHVHIRLIEPTVAWLQNKSESDRITPRIRTLINSCNVIEEDFEVYVLLVCSHNLNINIPEADVYKALSTLIGIAPHLQRNAYLDQILYESSISRSDANRTIDLFSPILLVFEVPAKL